jgi:hypothetical protein
MKFFSPISRYDLEFKAESLRMEVLALEGKMELEKRFYEKLLLTAKYHKSQAVTAERENSAKAFEAFADWADDYYGDRDSDYDAGWEKGLSEAADKAREKARQIRQETGASPSN